MTRVSLPLWPSLIWLILWMFELMFLWTGQPWFMVIGFTILSFLRVYVLTLIVTKAKRIYMQ